MGRNFEDEVKINRFKLELECERHPGLYHYYADQRAEARSALDDAEDELKLTISETEIALRKNWDESNGKQTEGAIKALIETNDEILQLKEMVRKAQHDVNTLDAAVYSLEHRKAMLDNLVTLLVKGFYAAPNGGRQDGMTESVQKETRKHLNRTKE